MLVRWGLEKFINSGSQKKKIPPLHGLGPLMFKATLPFMYLCVKFFPFKDEEIVEERPPSVRTCNLLLLLSTWKSILGGVCGGWGACSR